MSESTLIMRDISLQRRIRLQRYEFYLIYTNKKCKFKEKDLFPEKMYRICGYLFAFHRDSTGTFWYVQYFGL